MSELQERLSTDNLVQAQQPEQDESWLQAHMRVLRREIGRHAMTGAAGVLMGATALAFAAGIGRPKPVEAVSYDNGIATTASYSPSQAGSDKFTLAAETPPQSQQALSREKAIVKQWEAAGYSEFAAEGVAGYIDAEVGGSFNPKIGFKPGGKPETGSSVGLYGIQTPGMLKELKKFAKDHNMKHYDTVEAQDEFVIAFTSQYHPIIHYKVNAQGKLVWQSSSESLKQILNEAPTPAVAAKEFTEGFGYGNLSMTETTSPPYLEQNEIVQSENDAAVIFNQLHK